MTTPSPTPLWDSLSEKAVDRLLSEAPPFEFLILKGHLLVERALDILIDAGLKRPARLGRLRKDRRLSFNFKLALAQALGVLPDSYLSPIKALNEVRNKIAHVDGYAVTVEELLKFRLGWDTATFRAIKRDFQRDPTEATRTATLLLVYKCFELVADHEMQQRQSP